MAVISTVLLASGTVGTVQKAKEVVVGQIVTVTLTDEIGCPITETGKVAEVLEYEPLGWC